MGGLIQYLPRGAELVVPLVNPLRASAGPEDGQECLSLDSGVIKETPEKDSHLQTFKTVQYQSVSKTTSPIPDHNCVVSTPVCTHIDH